MILVHRFPLGKSAEIPAYLQPHKGVLKAHLRLVGIKQDGSVFFTRKGLAVPPGRPR